MKIQRVLLLMMETNVEWNENGGMCAITSYLILAENVNINSRTNFKSGKDIYFQFLCRYTQEGNRDNCIDFYLDFITKLVLIFCFALNSI